MARFTPSPAVSAASCLSGCPRCARRPTPRLHWTKTDASLSPDKLDNHDRRLHFKSIVLEDDGEYECHASNIHGGATHSFTVTVEGNERTAP